MLLRALNKAVTEAEAKLAALDKSQGIIEFDLDGNILTANANFLAILVYTLADIQGAHHSRFVEVAHRDSAEYADFWAKLRHGEYQSGRYKRVASDGREIWIRASYNPVRDRSGKPCKVVTFATDFFLGSAPAQPLAGEALEQAGCVAIEVAKSLGL
ncbi:hypothetical protein MOX02_48220 [Methylobacterium oxalidis]|uniref:PAS fold-3 domain-containing protein n=2 Tax=Methylobacterium oxalidis TaxID=944322 RepID=A0A512J9Z4_9HYPH|nr:PAS domain-containing protein [Methylobacterium oxalidis]GEP06784.1 hypothetical protein MOX02_48220 [Methylobacterium oxalidis]GJE34466.1 hypothetical protein LDDCCGHA_4677 [Methylobacterium oxalidis]GLS67088.1 hypothetical protein GCM10007888_54710 [Methylobacterium oxalidis]